MQASLRNYDGCFRLLIAAGANLDHQRDVRECETHMRVSVKSHHLSLFLAVSAVSYFHQSCDDIILSLLNSCISLFMYRAWITRWAVVLSVQDGNTAAMIACEGDKGCLRLLIAAGVDLERKNHVRELMGTSV